MARQKSRRLATLHDRLATVRADVVAGVVRGGKHLARNRHHLDATGVNQSQWRQRWEARRWFLQADGESGKRFGNETIRITPQGEVSIKLPAPLKEWANAPHSRYRLSGTAVFAHRGREWAERVVANRAVAYRVHLDADRGRWYLTASWQIAAPSQIPFRAALAPGVIGVDTNADHLAAWRLDVHGNPMGAPRRFDYQLSGTATHRDAQVRHALSGLLRWAQSCGVRAIAVEDLDFTTSKSREKHGRRKRFRQVISGIPTGKLRAQLLSMCAEAGIGVIAVDPAYTSRWGAQHWQKPLTSRKRRTSRHAAAAVAIGRRALGHAVLMYIHLEEGISSAELARRLQVSPQNIAGLVTRLESMGWVERRTHPRHRHVRELYLTDKGEAARSASDAVIAEIEEEIVRSLGDHGPRVRSALASLREAFGDTEP